MFIPKVDYDPHASMAENMTAIAHWLNFALRELCAGRVPEAKAEALRADEAQQVAQADTDEQTVELAYRLARIELEVM